MGIKDKRRITRTGRYSFSVTLPANLEKGEEATMAANRLVLMDPRGEIPPGKLLEFLEHFVEPNFWPWLLNLREVPSGNSEESKDGSSETF